MNIKLNGYVYIRDAFNQLGKMYFSDKWSGEEVLVHSSLESLVNKKYWSLLESGNKYGHIEVKNILPLLEKAKSDIVSEVRGVYEKSYSKEEWETLYRHILDLLCEKFPPSSRGRLDFTIFLELIMRYSYTISSLLSMLANGDLVYKLAPSHNANNIRLDELWLSERYKLNLEESLVASKHADQFNAKIYIEQRNLETSFDLTCSNQINPCVALKAALGGYLPPLMRIAVETAWKLNLSDDNQLLTKEIKGFIEKEYADVVLSNNKRGLSNHQIDYITTIVRNGDSMKGGSRKSKK